MEGEWGRLLSFLKEMGPEFNDLWNKYFKDKPDKPVMFGSIVSGAYADHALLPPGKYITMWVSHTFVHTEFSPMPS